MTKKKKEALSNNDFPLGSFTELRKMIAREICRVRDDGQMPEGVYLNNEAKHLLLDVHLTEVGETLHADIVLRGEAALAEFLGLWVEWRPKQKEPAVLSLHDAPEDYEDDDDD